MKFILFLAFVLPSFLMFPGCGDNMVYKDQCPLNNQPTTVQTFFQAPVQCQVQGQYLHCVRFQQ